MWATLPSLLHHAARRVASRRLSLLLLTLVSVGAWCLVVRGAFQYDDLPTIVRDPATQNLDALLGRLVTGVRPLTRISFFLNAALFGLSPAPFLATNLLLHLAAVLLVWALALTRLADARAALVAGMAFALQPAHAATIAYASGRSEGLSAMLVLTGLLLWEKRRTALALAVLAAACLARETTLVFPVLLLVWEATRPETATEPSPVSRRNALVLAAALASALALSLLALPRYRTLAAFSLRLRSPLATLVVNGQALPESLSLWVRPWALSVDHPFVPEGSVPASVLGLLLLAAGVLAAIHWRRRAPFLSLAVLWSLVTLAPTSSWIARLDFLTEKPLYLAWFGTALLLGRAFQWALGHLSARTVAVATAAFLSLAAVFSVERAWTWSDPIRLWLEATAKAPQSARCWNNLGMAYFKRELDPQAANAFRKASLLDPNDSTADRNLEVVEMLCGPRCY